MAVIDCFYVQNIGDTQITVNVCKISGSGSVGEMGSWSYDCANWNPINGSSQLVTLEPNEKVYLAGNTPRSYISSLTKALTTEKNWLQLNDPTLKIKVGGNLQSLVWNGDGSNTALKTKKSSIITYTYVFAGMFADAVCAVLDISDLRVSHNSYSRMYQEMFSDSVGVVGIPDSLFTITEGTACDYTFYRAFLNSDIREVAFTRGNYNGLVETTYEDLFYGCSNLQKITVDFTQWNLSTGRNPHKNWVALVSPTGNFICPEGLEEQYDGSHIPVGWTIGPPTPPCDPVPTASLIFQGLYAIPLLIKPTESEE